MSSYNISKNIINVNDDLFEIKKTFKESTVKDPVGLKDLFGYDFVFKKEGILYFVNKIEEPEIIEETQTQNQNEENKTS